MGVRNVERDLHNVAALRCAAPGDARTRLLRKALNDKVGLIVAKAAAVTAELESRELLPDLCAAFDRLLIDPVKTDPKCWGKEAIAKALKDLAYDESDIFRKGARHIQLEPVWGAEEDTAANLRATCALASLACNDLTREEKLWLIVPLLTERSPSLRKDAAFALECIGGYEAALLLRIKARMGDDDATVTGQMFESLLRVERESAIPFVVEFLRSTNRGTREEAALALGASRLKPAIAALKNEFTRTGRLLDSDLLCRALSISRDEAAVSFLLEILRSRRLNEARAALDGLGLYRESADVQEKVAAVINNRTESEIKRDFERLFGPA